MTRPAKKIVDAAINLAASDRLQIIEEILASLEPATDDDVDAALGGRSRRTISRDQERYRSTHRLGRSKNPRSKAG
jgi:hypothetical protein